VFRVAIFAALLSLAGWTACSTCADCHCDTPGPDELRGAVFRLDPVDGSVIDHRETPVITSVEERSVRLALHETLADYSQQRVVERVDPTIPLPVPLSGPVIAGDDGGAFRGQHGHFRWGRRTTEHGSQGFVSRVDETGRALWTRTFPLDRVLAVRDRGSSLLIVASDELLFCG
jgi:hypothetical protein